MTKFETIQKHIIELQRALEGTKRLVILTHDNPDPDSISAACALQFLVKQLLNVPAIMRYNGIVGRAENREMIRGLKLKIKLLGKNEIRPTDKVSCW